MKVELHTLSGRVVKVAQYPTTKLLSNKYFLFYINPMNLLTINLFLWKYNFDDEIKFSLEVP